MQSTHEVNTYIIISDPEGVKNELTQKLIVENVEPIYLSNGDMTDAGKNNVAILNDISKNYACNVLGNRDLNLLKRINILNMKDNIEDLLLPEIEYYNSFSKKEKDKLTEEYINTKEYNRPDHLMWSSAERPLVFLHSNKYLSFEEDGTVSLNENFTERDKCKFIINFLQWDCAKNQGAPNFLFNVLNEKLGENCANLEQLLNKNKAEFVYHQLLEFKKYFIIPALKKSKFVLDDKYLFNTHSSIREDVLFIPLSIIKLLGNVRQEDCSSYTDVFKQTKSTYKAKTIEKAGLLYNRAWEKFLDELEKGNNDPLIKDAAQDFIQLGLPNNPQGFCTASQVRDTSERRSSDELFKLKEIVDPNRNILINFVGHKPSVFPSLNLQEVGGLHIYTIRIDQSLNQAINGGSAAKISYNNDNITIELIRTYKEDIKSESGDILIPKSENATLNTFVINRTTGQLLKSSQNINAHEIQLPLANRYHDKWNNQEWRIISAKLKPNSTDIEEYILTSVAGDEDFKTAKGKIVPKFNVTYRSVSPEQLKNDYDLIPIEALELQKYEKNRSVTVLKLEETIASYQNKNQILTNKLEEAITSSQNENQILTNKNSKLYAGIFSYRLSASATLLAGVGLTAASLLTDFPYLEIGVAIAGAVLAVIIISAVVDLLNKQWHGPSLFAPNSAGNTSRNGNLTSVATQNL